MNKLPFALIFGFIFWGGIFVAFSPKAHAVTIAEQTQGYGNSLNVWRAIQELGDNLSGTTQGFTFRVSTTVTNHDQFDWTAENSKIYDKTTGTYISGCVPSGSNPADDTRGLTFNTANVPSGYQDVTIDFSCHNYNFIAGHKYLILITNSNMAAFGGGWIRFAAAAYSGTSNDYFIGGGLRYAFDNAVCYPADYIWNSQTSNNGCNIWTTSKDDLYFILTNTSPPPKTPVIFIPGIGGSEMKAAQDIIWSKMMDMVEHFLMHIVVVKRFG